VLHAAGADAGPNGSFGGAIPAADPYETGFTSRQRNIFRQSFQKRADASMVKMTNFTERYALKYTFDVYNLTNTTSFDVPFNEVSQNASYNPFPAAGTPVLPGTCNNQGVGTVPGSFYSCPAGPGDRHPHDREPAAGADVAGVDVLSKPRL
jgi:hypothetical protein